MPRIALLLLFIADLAALRAQKPRLVLPMGHSDPVKSAQYSPDGKMILTASEDRTAKIWDARSGKLLIDLAGHTDGVNGAAFSDDGTTILTYSLDLTAKTWDARTGALLVTFAGHMGDINSASFSRDGKKIVTASADRTARIWDARSGRLLQTILGHQYGVNSATFSPNGEMLLTTSEDRTAKLWDAASGKMLRSFQSPGWGSGFESARFSPDGSKLAFAGYKELVVIDPRSLEPLLVEEFKNDTRWISFSPDSRQLAVLLENGTLALFNDSGSHWQHKYLAAHTGGRDYYSSTSKLSVEFSPDGSRLLTVAGPGDSTKIWDARTLERINTLPLNTESQETGNTGYARFFRAYDFAPKVRFSPSANELVILSENGEIRTVNGNTGEVLSEIRGLESRGLNAAFSPDGLRYLTVQPGQLSIWDLKRATPLLTIRDDPDRLRSAFFSPDGKKIITTSPVSNIITTWDAERGNKMDTLSAGFIRGMVRISGNGRYLLTQGDYFIKVWDLSSRISIAEFTSSKETKIRRAVFSGDSKNVLISLADNGTAIWDFGRNKIVSRMKESFETYAGDGGKFIFRDDEGNTLIRETGSRKNAVKLNTYRWRPYFHSEFSRNNERLVTTSYGNTAQVWDPATGELTLELKGHTGWINSVTFSPDGNFLLTASSDNTFRLWNARTGRLVYAVLSMKDRDFLVFDDKNHFDGPKEARSLVYFTCETEVIDLDQLKDQLWKPRLAERIMGGEIIEGKALEEMDICGVTPVVEDHSTSEFIHFRITPRKGGVGKLELFLNENILIRTLSLKDLRKEGSSYELVVPKSEFTPLFIQGTTNLLSLTAYTETNSFASRGLIVRRQAEGRDTTIPNLFAVIIGVSDYKGEELDLQYADKDANDFSNLLSRAAGKLLNIDGKEHVFIYPFTTSGTSGQFPEKTNIRKAFYEIGEKCNPNDIILVFFAGHGTMAKDSASRETGQFYFLTADASKATLRGSVADVGIGTAEIIEWMKPQHIKAQKRVFIFDACNSGQFILDYVKIGKPGQQYLAARNDERAQQIQQIDKLNERAGFFVLSASASDQEAYELGKYSQGLLTYSLLKSVKERTDILSEGRYLDVSRWFNATENIVAEITKESLGRQQPQMISGATFHIGKVDEEVISNIKLENERPVFTNSGLQNADAAIAFDNLDLNSMIDEELNYVSSRGVGGHIAYAPVYKSGSVWQLAGRYEVSGNNIIVRLALRKGKEVRHRLEVRGAIDKLQELSKKIVEEAVALAR